MTDLYEREERLLSNRQRLTRNVFFALTTSREQANVAHKTAVSTELSYVDPPPKLVPRNVYIGRNIGRHAPTVNTQAAAADNEAEVQRAQMKLQAEAEKTENNNKPQEDARRHVSTLGAPGVTISRLPRFGSAGSNRPGSAGGGGGSNNDTGRGSSGGLSPGTSPRNHQPADSLTTPRRPVLSARQAQIELDKENEIAAQRAAALFPTHFVRKELRESRERVAQLSARPSFGVPPPRPCSALSLSLSARRRQQQQQQQQGDEQQQSGKKKKNDGDDEGSPLELQEGIGLPRASDFVFPWEVKKKEKRQARVVDTAAMDSGSPSSWLEAQYLDSDGNLILDDDEARRRAESEWHAQRERLLDSWGLLQGARSSDAAKQRAGLSHEPGTVVNMKKQVGRDEAVSYHAVPQQTRDLFYDVREKTTSRNRRHVCDVRLDKYAARGGTNVRPFFHVPDDLLKSDHLLKTHRGMVERERNNFVRLLTDATEEELRIMKQHEKDAEAKRKEIEQLKLLMSANANNNSQSAIRNAASRSTIGGGAARRASASAIGGDDDDGGSSVNGGGGGASAAMAAELRRKEAQLASLEMDPLKVARCEAAKTFLQQFTPPDSVDVPGAPVSIADDARFNDGFTTATRARPKTSGEAIVTRRFKGAPNLGSYSDRPGGDFAAEFAGAGFFAARRAAAKEVDAQLARAELLKRMRR